MTLGTLARQLPALWQDARFRQQLWNGMGILAGLGAGVASYALFHEPLHVRLDRLTIRLPGAQKCLPRQGLRILHISDTHYQGRNWREQAKTESIQRLCRGLEYDLFVHTGDFLHHDDGLPNLMDLLDRLPPPRLGGYAVFGNHDYSRYSHRTLLSQSWQNYCAAIQRNGHEGRRRHQALASMAELVRFGRFFLDTPLDMKRSGRNDVSRLEQVLTSRNIHVLHNRFVHLTHRVGRADGVDLYISGVDDVVEGKPDLQQALGGIPDDAPVLLLSHNPDILAEPESARADVILAGHTHGLPIVLPWLGAAHTQSLHLSRHQVSGYLQRGKTHVYITRGVGEGIPIRLGARPQVTFITLLPG